MHTSVLQQRLATYQQWKARVARAIADLETWLDEHRRATPRARERLHAAAQFLAEDRLTIAIVAECPSARIDLINALFFSGFGLPLLPSAPVDSTSCATELWWDGGRGEAYLRLLPVETRAQDRSLSEFRADPRQWVHYPLNLQEPELAATTLREIRQAKRVSSAEATRLGLSVVGLDVEGAPAADSVEIPKWRHALLSLPNPLFQQGLVVLDTPGPDALGAEPELTMGLLPAVQAVIFVVSAESGVTRRDLEIWQHHLKGFQAARQRAILVALDHPAPLWGAQGGAPETEVAEQRRAVAETLGIAEECVIPLSAALGSAAKMRQEETQLRRSALPTLERHLATRMLETKHQQSIAAIDASVGQVLDRNRSRVASRITRVKAQLEELEQLRDKSQDVIAQLLERTRREQERYLRSVQAFQQRREELLTETRHCRRLLEHEGIEVLIERAHGELEHSWTTTGLARAMKGLFDELRRVMQAVATESERIRRLVREVYQGFREEFEFDLAVPKVFVPMKYRVEIELLYQEVEAFRRSPAMALSGQGMVIRRFDQQMVSRARVLFDQLRIAFDGWIRDTLKPLAEEIQERKLIMEKRLENLQRIGRSKDALQKRIDDMQVQHLGFAQELTALRNIYNALHYDPLTEQDAPPKPRLVAG